MIENMVCPECSGLLIVRMSASLRRIVVKCANPDCSFMFYAFLDGNFIKGGKNG